MLYTNCQMLQQKHLIFVGLHHTSIIRLSLPRPRAPFASRPLRRSQLPPSAKSSQDLSQMVDEAMGKWGINQWMNQQWMNPWKTQNHHQNPSSNLRVQKAPLFDPFLAPPPGFSCISDTSCNGRLLSAFPFQFQLHLQLTVGGLVGAAQLAQVFNLYGQLGDRGWEDTSWILCVLKKTKKMETAGSWLSHKL